MINNTAVMILATQYKKLITPMLALSPQGNQMLVASAPMTSITSRTIACVVPVNALNVFSSARVSSACSFSSASSS